MKHLPLAALLALLAACRSAEPASVEEAARRAEALYEQGEDQDVLWLTEWAAGRCHVPSLLRTGGHYEWAGGDRPRAAAYYRRAAAGDNPDSHRYLRALADAGLLSD